MNFHHDLVAATVGLGSRHCRARKAHPEFLTKPDREPQSPSVQTRVSWSGVVGQSPPPITDY
jgi:hypothetical protein